MSTMTPAARPAGYAASAGTSVAVVQGLYYLATGVWPLIHIESFMDVTGRKTDLWLVYTVGALVSVVGLVLLNAARGRPVSSDAALLAVGCAVALAGIDVVFVARRVIDPIYLADAGVQAALILWWGVARSTR
jgi:hypothetical protein